MTDSEEKYTPNVGDAVLIDGNTIATITAYNEDANLVGWEHKVGGAINVMSTHISQTRIEPLDALFNREDLGKVEGSKAEEPKMKTSETQPGVKDEVTTAGTFNDGLV